MLGLDFLFLRAGRGRLLHKVGGAISMRDRFLYIHVCLATFVGAGVVDHHINGSTLRCNISVDRFIKLIAKYY